MAGREGRVAQIFRVDTSRLQRFPATMASITPRYPQKSGLSPMKRVLYVNIQYLFPLALSLLGRDRAEVCLAAVKGKRLASWKLLLSLLNRRLWLCTATKEWDLGVLS